MKQKWIFMFHKLLVTSVEGQWSLISNSFTLAIEQCHSFQFIKRYIEKTWKGHMSLFKASVEDNLKNYTHPTIIIVLIWRGRGFLPNYKMHFLINFEGCTEVLKQQKATCLAIFGYWWFYLMKSCEHSRKNILPCNPGHPSNLQSDVAHLCSTCMWFVEGMHEELLTWEGSASLSCILRFCSTN